MGRLRAGKLSRPRVRISAPDPTLTGVSGMAAVAELVEALGVVALLDAMVGPIKSRDRGMGAGELLAGLGVRDGQAMIATLWHRLLCIPGRLIHHAGQLILRLPPDHQLLPTVLARLRALPHLS